MIGQRLSPILKEIEDTLWEFEIHYPNQRPIYNIDGFKGSIKIFMSDMLDKMWGMQEDDNIDMVDRQKMAERLGEEIKRIVMTYTGINTHELYK